MKKALLVIAIAAIATNVSAKKAKTVEAKSEAATVTIKTSSDSLSYAGGYAYTNGLIPYLQQSLHVDTAYMADFIKGMEEAKTKLNDPRFKAYQAGAQIAQMVEERMIASLTKELKGTADTLSTESFYNGFIAALKNDTTTFNENSAQEYFRKAMERNIRLRNEATKLKNKAWFEENAKKEGVITTASGLQYKVITMGTGVKPTATQEVTVKYEGHLLDGTEFDSSYKRPGQTTKFKCNQVIKGWTEGLQLMPVGSKFEFYIPEDLGYGEQEMNAIPACSALIFTVELVDVKAEEAKPAEKAEPAKKDDAAKKVAVSAKKPAKKVVKKSK